MLEIPVLIPFYEVLKGLLINVEFARGVPILFDSLIPPTIVFFKSLPSKFLRQNWGVYILILKRPGLLIAIYIGSFITSRGSIMKRI